MAAGPIRIYADTSVFGGVLDEEFATPSLAFFDEVRAGRFTLLTSAAVREEIGPAPDDVRAFFDGMLSFMEFAEVSAEARRLQAAYLRAGVVGESGKTDALHVALATVSGCRAIVSWNFTHIVHFDKIPLYNGVSLVGGYGQLGIHTPQEVVSYEAEDKDV